MKTLLTAPTKMQLAAFESGIYQQILKRVPDVSLNLLAIKVDEPTPDFTTWCHVFLTALDTKLNRDLLDEPQFPVIEQLRTLLIKALKVLTLRQLKVAPVALLEAQLENPAAEPLRLLAYYQTLNLSSFSQLNELDQGVVLAKHSASHDVSVYDFDSEWFASTRHQRAFHALVSANPAWLDDCFSLLAQIETIKEADYHKVVDAFIKGHDSETRPNVFVLSQLLSVARPDVFMPLTTATAEIFADAFGSAKIKADDFNGYWQAIMLTRTMPYLALWPTDHPLYSVRAFIPWLLRFEDPLNPHKSRYQANLEKPARKGQTRKVKKASLEEMLTRYFDEHDVPAHIQAKKEAIISEVEKGRSIQDTIALLRVIYG